MESDDSGYFKEIPIDDSNHGQFKQNTIRACLCSCRPSDKFDLALRIENGDQDGSGPAAQCHLGANGTGCQSDDGAAVPAPK